MIPHLSTRRTNGAALIVTLSLLVLAAALVLTVFLTVTNERTESSANANQSDAQHLATGVVNVVKSTITQATSGYETNAANGTFNTGAPTAWASQPGLIRTWKMDGTPSASFRLYSSGAIVTTGSLDIAAEQTAVAQWKSSSGSSSNSYNALWCDLNAPALSGSGQRIYPIVTPPKDGNSGSGVTDPGCGIPTDNPATATQEGVQGFSISSAPGFVSGTSPSAVNNPAPMPVKWFYVLQDGSFITPSGSGSNATVAGAKKTNQIVARVAYWTDDETCKVNVNTANEYYYWEPPATYTNADVNVRAQFQPGADEYQRYPGHPATNCLSTVFEKLGPASDTETAAARAQRYQKASNLTPRISSTSDGKPYSGSNAGGSQAGTAICWRTNTSPQLVMDCDRLYATAEDLLYNPSRAEQLVSQGLLDKPGDLQQRLCFLTARNTSPDLNWMGRPRISLWPLNPKETSKWSAYDKLLAFCGTANSSIYYFQRSNGFDPSADADMTRNMEIYNYLKNMLSAPIPGAGGGTFSSKTTRDCQQILTNIFDYVRCFINFRYVGGYKGGNVDDPAKSYWFPPGQASGAIGCFAAAPTVLSDNGKTTRGPGGFPVVSDVILHFWAVKPGETTPASVTQDYPSSVPGSGASIKRTIQMNLLLNLASALYNNNMPSPQYQIRISGNGWSVTGGTDPAIDASVAGGGSALMSFPTANGSVMRVYSPHTSTWGVNMTGGYYGIPWLYRGSSVFTQAGSFVTRSFSRTAAANTFTFYSDPINLSIPIGSAMTAASGSSVSRTDMQSESQKPATAYFNGGSIKIEIFPGIKDGGTAETDSYDLNSTQPIQTITVNVPSCVFPVPLLGSKDIINNDQILDAAPGKVTFYDFGSWAKRGYYNRLSSYITQRGWNNVNPWIMDVVRGVTLDPAADHKGDLRVVAHARNIPQSWYKAEYTGTEKDFILSTAVANYETTGTSVSKLDSTVNYIASTIRLAAPSLNGMQRNGTPNAGDFINGWGSCPLGGYYLGPDIGYVPRNNDTTTVPYYSSQEYADARAVNNAMVYSPARMVSSPLILGKLSAYASETQPNAWETLLFCRNPVGGTDSHNGWTSPRDHYLLDLFKMPVVEPYAISQPLSTDGRVNLNSQMVPFSYINRSTGLYAALKGTRLYAINVGTGTKQTSTNVSGVATDYAQALDVDKTIAQIQQRAPFITPSEFTEVFLIPQGQTASTIDSFWKSQKGTGDDLREAPYDHIYPKLTTQSNTYTVHMRVQSLKQVPTGRSADADWEKWNETRDQVVSEYRGSSTIERYVDPNDTSVPDFVKSANYGKNLAPYYRWRTISEHQFVP